MIQGYPQKISDSSKVDGVPSGPTSEAGKRPEEASLRISVKLTFSTGLHILQKDLDYPGLYRLIQKLEGLC